ncbi:MAG: hypothetical protein RSE93_01980 [Oscillospiraceae bacterium]
MAKKNTLLWSISLVVISIVTIIFSGSNIIGIELPDVIIRIFGILYIIAVPIFLYSSIKFIYSYINRRK